MDTAYVKVCLDQLSTYILNSSNALPLDTKRWFNPEQRQQIWAKSGAHCAMCKLEISRTNFHCDHIIPHVEGGPTAVENGQALCAECNYKKGKDIIFKK